MTKEKGMRYGCCEVDELTRHRVKGELEQVMAGKELVDMDSIFDNDTFENARDMSQPLVILVEGALGSGKTTLAHHYCHEWANGNLTMFDLVALVYLRHPAVHSAGLNMSLDEILLVHVGSGKNVERDTVENVAQLVQDGLKFLLILEGWDEAPACLRAPPDPKYQYDNSFLGKLLCSVSPNTTVFITSRPDSSVDLHKRVDRVEILGFTKKSIHDYFQETLSTQLSSDEVTVECSKLKEHFSKYPAIESSCYIPLNAAILTLVYLERNRTLPTTQHELLCELLLCLIDREVNTRQPNREQESISSLDDLPHDLNEHLNNICMLAYEGIMQDKVVFSQQEISALLSQPVQQDIPAMGVLQKVQWAGIRSKTMSYSFSHLSIQELLAAYCISKMEQSEQVRVFQTLLDKPRFSAVLQFYAGFTKLTNQGVREIITGTDFTSGKSSKPFLLSYMRCFFEAQVTDESLYQLLLSQLNGQIYLNLVTLSPLDCISVGYFLAYALRHSELRVDLSVCSLNDHLFGLLFGELTKHAEEKAALHEVTELIMTYNEFDIADSIATALQTNTTRLRTLNVSVCSISDEGVESLARALAVNRSLQELDISRNQIGDNGIAHIATALQTNTTTMTTLNISNCSISDVGAESLARALAVNRSIQELDIRSNEIGDNGIAHIATALQKNTTMRTLDISNCSISDVEADSLASFVNISLQYLNICNNEIGDNGIACIATALQTNTTMRTLDIYNCSISDEGAESLARALAVNRSLQELDISSNEIGDNGIAHIATALQTNTTLRTLIVSSCQISDVGAESLARALAVNRSIQELDIRSNEIGDNGIAHIATALQTNTTMRKLNNSDCGLSDEGVESLAVALTLNTSIESLRLDWSSTHLDSTLEKIGECISTNNVLIELQMCISATPGTEFLHCHIKFILSLENNHLQRLFLDYFEVWDDAEELEAAAATVNSARSKKGLPNLILEVNLYG